MDRPHIGFCLAEYDKETCRDCPAEKECLELKEKENKQVPILEGQLQPKQRRQVEEQMMIMDKCLSELGELITNLHNRLEAVLTEQTPEPDCEKDENPAEALCPLAATISGNRKIINGQMGRIKRILKRLEL